MKFEKDEILPGETVVLMKQSQRRWRPQSITTVQGIGKRFNLINLKIGNVEQLTVSPVSFEFLNEPHARCCLGTILPGDNVSIMIQNVSNERSFFRAHLT